MTEKLNEVMDYREHYRTYDLFIGLIKYGTIISLLVVAFMAITLL
ncbi:aa3-type cytochrome c oxidase subunit IV [uncultured Cohaesibacter sp.]|nr:aa3-type cytochrome c oxidase subunit IV [uncultured Cohaesibacter sp.]